MSRHRQDSSVSLEFGEGEGMSTSHGDSGGQDWLDFIQGVESLDKTPASKQKRHRERQPQRQKPSLSRTIRPLTAKRSPVPAASKSAPQTPSADREVFDALKKSQLQARRLSEELKAAQREVQALRAQSRNLEALRMERDQLLSDLELSQSEAEKMRQESALFRERLEASKARIPGIYTAYFFLYCPA